MAYKKKHADPVAKHNANGAEAKHVGEQKPNISIYITINLSQQLELSRKGAKLAAMHGKKEKSAYQQLATKMAHQYKTAVHKKN